MENPSVLVVERSRAARASLTRALKAKGYTVHAVESRAEGFDLLDELGPDLLILDDPAEGHAYRLVWLRESDRPDLHVELLDLRAEVVGTQLDGLLPTRSIA